jgi:cytolysin-activating lysine-acyltransferase
MSKSNQAAQVPDENAAGAEAPAEKTANVVNISPGARFFGEVVWLLAQSPAHRHLFMADLEWAVMPPLALQQFRVVHDGKKPVAAVLWAMVSEEVEKELIAGMPRLRPGDWKSGDRPWLMEVIAPGLAGDAKAMQRIIGETARSAFGEAKFRMRATDPKTGATHVVEMGVKPK